MNFEGEKMKIRYTNYEGYKFYHNQIFNFDRISYKFDANKCIFYGNNETYEVEDFVNKFRKDLEELIIENTFDLIYKFDNIRIRNNFTNELFEVKDFVRLYSNNNSISHIMYNPHKNCFYIINLHGNIEYIDSERFSLEVL